MTTEQMRQRIAELEEGLRPMADAWKTLQTDGGLNDPERPSHGTGTIKQKHLCRAASLLSAAPPASEPGHKCYEGHILRQRDNDIGILIAIVESLLEASGESLDTEDNALFGQIRNDHENRTDPASEPAPEPDAGDVERVVQWLQSDRVRALVAEQLDNPHGAPVLTQLGLSGDIALGILGALSGKARAAITALTPLNVGDRRKLEERIKDIIESTYGRHVEDSSLSASAARAVVATLTKGDSNAPR